VVTDKYGVGVKVGSLVIYETEAEMRIGFVSQVGDGRYLTVKILPIELRARPVWRGPSSLIAIPMTVLTAAKLLGKVKFVEHMIPCEACSGKTV
jgi:hypothetical protein